jgi:hypothetical protein
VWRQNFARTSGSGAAVSAVPEPDSALLAFVAAAGLCALSRGFWGHTVTVDFSDS